jgi:hypothetical protein
MSETIKYVKVDPSDAELDQRYSTGTQEKLGEIELGAERLEGYGKDFVSITLHREGKERFAGVYVAKKFPSEREARNEIEKCTILDRNGISVPNTYRYAQVGENHLVVYTDLSNGGENQVWSANNFEVGEPLDLTPEQFDSVVEQVAEISAMASAISYNIRYDAYFVVRKPDGDVSVIIGDLGLSVSRRPRELAILGEENKHSGNLFLSWTQRK